MIEKDTKAKKGSVIMCVAEREDLKHFVMWCQEYNQERIKHPKLGRPYREDEDWIIGDLLFYNDDIEITKEILHAFWKKKREEEVRKLRYYNEKQTRPEHKRIREVPLQRSYLPTLNQNQNHKNMRTHGDCKRPGGLCKTTTTPHLCSCSY